jgi:hypothetical protein
MKKDQLDINLEDLLGLDQKALDYISAQQNALPLADFLGLSPTELHELLYSPLDNLSSIIILNSTFNTELLENVPLILKGMVIIKMLSEAGEVKATQNGFLPKKIVNAVYNTAPDPFFHHEFEVPSEERFPSILALRYNLVDCGWVKLRNRKFSLTKTGSKLAEKGFSSEDYVKLLVHRLMKHNWAFEAGNPEILFIQTSALFLLFILFQQGNQLFNLQDLTRIYLRAFPSVLEDIPDEFVYTRTKEEFLELILKYRFIRHLAHNCGLIEFLLDDSLPPYEREEAAKYRTTELFKQVVKFSPRNQAPFQ